MLWLSRSRRGTEPREDELTTDSRTERVTDEDARDAGGGRRRRVAARAVTGAAFLLVLLALVTPAEIARLTPGAFVRVPIEGVLGVGLILVLPARARRYAAGAAGAVLGLLFVLKVLDIGFDAVLVRPFDLVLDWPLLRPAVEFVDESAGAAGATTAVVLTVVLAVGVIVLMSLSALRLSRVIVRHDRTAARAAAVLGTIWVVCAVLGAQLVHGVPVASRSAAVLAYDHARAVRSSLNDREEFAKAAAVDRFRDTPGDRLLAGLRGKDVVLAFVESYGRSAVESPQYAPQVDAVLDRGSQRLRQAGFAARSGWLTSSTAGGGSWLAHATLLSGLWISNQQRYRTLVNSDRLTLNGAFHKADARTVALMPAITRAWPEGEFYGYDKVYDDRNLGYRGPRFSFATMPDQYTLSTLQRTELAKKDRPAVMAETALVSSHAPWASIPRLVPWDEVGDGSVFDGMGKGYDAPWPPGGQIRTEYRKSIEYTLNTLVSYLETYGNDRTVLIFLGDHQPAPLITGAGAGRDVPITIVAKDQAVIDKISGWNWQDGLRPAKDSPVWPMSAFRDRFLTAFG
ncbi:Phosphoglycerol transferase and related proteins%2C alkaline phosphatase superfamily [Mycobacterium tuberculosis]|nr:Phosphoglycerol transferase and related proteins%2C alkaline phosphatase superfamily [Mycobacterium tuberculosis]